MRCKARDSSQLICVRCRKIGHLARACPANFADPLPKEERNKIYQNAKNGRNLYDAARATPDGKVAEKVAPAAGKSAGMAVVETKPIPQEGDTLDVGLLSAAAVQGLRYIDVRLEFPDRRSHSYNEVWEQALIDSGADACFAGEALAKDIESHGGDYIRTLPRSITVTLANGAKTRPVGYVSGVNVWLNDAHKVEIDRIYIMPVVGGSMRGIIIPYSLLGGLTVSWTLTPEGETTVVLGETARLIYDYSKAVAGSQPRCTVAIQNRDEGRDSPIHCSVIDTVEPNGSSKNDDIKTVVPLRLIPDEDAIDGRPTVGIPWRRRDKRPPPNFKTCYVRDKRTFERLDEEQIKQCLGAFQVFTDRKYVLPTLPSAQVSKETCYPKNDDELFDGDRHAECLTKRFIPMFPVWDRVSVSTKCRLVLDARSDNSFILPTPSGKRGTRSSLYYNIFHFRCSEYYILLDLSSAFLEVSLACGDREYAGTILHGKAYRFGRMPFGSVYSPYGLWLAIDRMIAYWETHPLYSDDGKLLPDLAHFVPTKGSEEGEWMPTGEKPNWNMSPEELLNLLAYYVDDWCIGGMFPLEVMRAAIYVIWRLGRHGSHINLRKVMSFLRGLDANEFRHLGYHVKNGMINSLYGAGRGAQREGNDLRFGHGSKGLCVSLLSREFDPLGLAIEHASQMRLLLRKVTMCTRSWEAVVPDALYNEVLEWVATVSDNHSTILWDRFCDPSTLFCFCDASEALWACDVRCEGPRSKSPHVRFVGSVGVHPLTSRSIPAKELDSLYRAVELIKKVMLDCPKVEKVTFFTDSEITIHRLRAWSSGKYQRLGLGTFEKNRLQKINGFLTRRRFTVEHIIGRADPADAATRPGKETLTSKEIDYGLKKSKRRGNLRYDPQAYKSVVNAFSVATERTRDGEDYELVLPGDSQLRSKLVQSQLRDQWIQGMKIKIKEGATLKSPQTRGLQVHEGTGLLGKRTLSWNAADGKRTVDLGGLRYIIPDADTLLQDETIARLHIHGGVPMNIRRLCSEFYFKHMKAKCKKYVNNCDVCEKLRADRSCRKATGALPSWQVGWLPWECISLDYVGPLCPGAELPVQKDENPSGFRYYLSFVDVATKYMINVPVRDRSVSSLIATVKEVFLEREQVPKCLITDQEQSFLSKAFQSFLLSLPFTIHHVIGAPYQGPHAGHYERLHADITKFLQGALVAAGEDTYCWHRHLQHATQLHNTLPYDECIDVSPAELFRGYVPRKAMDNATVEETIEKLHMVPPPVSRAIRDVAEQLKETRDIKFREYRRLWELRRSEAFEKVLANVRQHRDFEINDTVYRWRPAQSKLSTCWDGPWRITKLLGKTRAILSLVKDPVVQSYESVINLKMAKSCDDSLSGSDDDVDHWVECTRCGKWRLVTQEECERFKDEDDVTCEDMHSSCESPCDWVTLGYDDVEKTSTLVKESEALPTPIKQVKSSMNGFGSLVVFLLLGDDSTTTLTHSLGVIEEVDESNASFVLNTGEDLVPVSLGPNVICYVFQGIVKTTPQKFVQRPTALIRRTLRDVYGYSFGA